MRTKGQVWISAVLYILIAAVIMVLILQGGMPILNKMRDRGNFDRATNTLSAIDDQIDAVAEEGQGSQRVLPLEVRDGKVMLGDGSLRWEMETSSEIIQPRTKIQIGNLQAYSNVDVATWETKNSYLLTNKRLNVSILKTEFDAVNRVDLSDLITEIVLVEDDSTISNPYDLAFSDSCNTYDIRTELIPEGNNTNLGSAQVLVSGKDPVSSDCIVKSFDLVLTLESEADFLSVRLINMETN